MFSALSGEWQLGREFSTGETFTGTARFDPASNNRLRLTESGNLKTKQDTLLEASRSWLWQLEPDGGLVVLYDETPPRVYHSLVPERSYSVWTARGAHLCGKDHYAGAYTISPEKIVVAQRVRGPYKDYDMVSRYSK